MCSWSWPPACCWRSCSSTQTHGFGLRGGAPDNPCIASHILIVPDKFKGTLTARQAAEAIAAGWLDSRPGDTTEVLPMSDGGDGFGVVIGDLLGAGVRPVATVDAAHRPIQTVWWWHQPSATAVIESAGVVGLAQLPPGEYHPFQLDTFGLGAVLRAAREAGVQRCLIGIGGSATNDGGFGVARALGWRFIGEDGGEIERWTDLDRLATIHPPDPHRWFGECIVAVDVQNPLLGPEGCSRIYGPQKGLVDFEAAERALTRLAAVVGGDLATQPGAGAAGGLGFGLAAFAGATLRPGFEVFAEAAGLAERMDQADLVITGEGSLDAQSLMGKGVGEIAAMARTRGIPCVAMVGRVEGDVGDAFAAVHAIDAPIRAGETLEAVTALVAADWLE